MVTVNKGGVSAADEYIAELERELAGTQEMLAFVLKSVGKPVVVTKEALAQGLDGVVINVDDDVKAEAFTFSLIEAE